MNGFITIEELDTADIATSVNTWALQAVDRTSPIYDNGQRIYAPGKTIWVRNADDLMPAIMDILTDPFWELSVTVTVYDYSPNIGYVVIVKTICVTL